MELESKLNYLFGEHQLLEYPNVAYLSFVTPFGVSQTVLQIAHDYMNLESKLVWDMFAGIGTDSIELSKYAGKVVATEVNKETFACLVKNTKRLKSAVECLHRDAVNNWVKSDVVYFDPPWGKNYTKYGEFNFLAQTVGSYSIRELIQLLNRKHDMIIKMPINSSDGIEALFDPAQVVHRLKFTRQRVQFYLITRKEK